MSSSQQSDGPDRNDPGLQEQKKDEKTDKWDGEMGTDSTTETQNTRQHEPVLRKSQPDQEEDTSSDHADSSGLTEEPAPGQKKRKPGPNSQTVSDSLDKRACHSTTHTNTPTTTTTTTTTTSPPNNGHLQGNTPSMPEETSQLSSSMPNPSSDSSDSLPLQNAMRRSITPKGKRSTPSPSNLKIRTDKDAIKYTRDVDEIQKDIHAPNKIVSPQSPVDVKTQPEYTVEEPSQVKTPAPPPESNSLITSVEEGQQPTVPPDLDVSNYAPANAPTGQYLLPPLLPNAPRKCLVLDLDETLVHSSFKVMHESDFVIPVEIDGQVHRVYVVKRPGVDEFLKEMGKIYEIVVFTASLAKYADPVLDLLDIHHVVHHRLFRESCCNLRGNYVKDLSMLGRDLRHVIIIDNSPTSYVFNPSNAVPISSWFSDPNDRELNELIPFLEHLSSAENVMSYLSQAIDTVQSEEGDGV